MAAEDVETERTEVKTYVPAYQKAEWQAQAADLDMSQSEFVRTMVQAGRRDFDLEPPELQDSDVDPGGQGLEARVLAILDSEGAMAWDELLAAVTADLEDDLEAALTELQERNEVVHSGREGGYSIVGGTE
jgi:hypothetical protein